jgi:hypothetical protein
MPDQQNPVPPATKANKAPLSSDQWGTNQGPLTEDQVASLVPKEIG